MADDLNDIIYDINGVNRAAREAVVPLQEINAALQSGGLRSSGLSFAGGGIRGTGVLGSGREDIEGSGGGRSFSSLRNNITLGADLINGNYENVAAHSLRNKTIQGALKSFGIEGGLGGLAGGAAIFAAVQMVKGAFDEVRKVSKDASEANKQNQDIVSGLSSLQDYGGRRASVREAEKLVAKQTEKEIKKLGFIDKTVNRVVGDSGVLRQTAEFASEKLKPFGLDFMTRGSELREKAAEQIQKDQEKAKESLEKGYAAIAKGNLTQGSNALREANKNDPNVGKMWSNPGAIWASMESARISSVMFAASRMKRAAQREGD